MIALEEDVSAFTRQVKGKKIRPYDQIGRPGWGFSDAYFIADGDYSQDTSGKWLLPGIMYQTDSDYKERVTAIYRNGFNFDEMGLCWRFLEEEKPISRCWCGKDKYGFANHMLSCPCWQPLNLKE